MLSFLRRNKLALLLCIIFVCLLGAMLLLFINYQKRIAIYFNKQELQLVANEKASQIDMFLDFQKNRAAALASLTAFKEVAMYPNDPAKLEAASNMINQLKGTIPNISILTKEGIVIVGETDPPGADYSATPVFPASEETKVYFSLYYDPYEKADYYAVGELIRDNQNKIAGVIAFDVELDKVSDIMKETLKSKTSETYLIDETGLLLSASKYIDQGGKKGVLVQKVQSEGAKSCLEDLALEMAGKEDPEEAYEEQVTQYLNYAGNDVFGAHAFVPAVGGCIIAEKSADEISGFSLKDYILNIFSKK